MNFVPPGVLFANALNISQKNNMCVVHFALEQKAPFCRVLFLFLFVLSKIQGLLNGRNTGNRHNPNKQLNKKQQNQYYEKRDANGQHDLVSYNFLHYKKSVGFLKTPANVENFLIGCH
jgi:hypothetical protein